MIAAAGFRTDFSDRAANCAKVGGGFLPAEGGCLIVAVWLAGFEGCRSDVLVVFKWGADREAVLSAGCTAERLGPACTLDDVPGLPTLVRSYGSVHAITCRKNSF